MISTVFIVDDHPLMRRGYTSLLNDEPDIEVVGQATTAEEALQRIPEAGPDLVLLDLSLPGTNGIELLKRLRAITPNIRVLIISMHDEELYAERSLMAGAAGYLMKTCDDDLLLNAVRRVLRGNIYLSEDMSRRILGQIFHGGGQSRSSPLDTLSDRELEVFEHIGRGRSTREIADLLCVSPKTVESQRARIKEKLRLESSTDLLRYAFSWIETGETGRLAAAQLEDAHGAAPLPPLAD